VEITLSELTEQHFAPDWSVVAYDPDRSAPSPSLKLGGAVLTPPGSSARKKQLLVRYDSTKPEQVELLAKWKPK
jgi:hypothetical protein